MTQSELLAELERLLGEAARARESIEGLRAVVAALRRSLPDEGTAGPPAAAPLPPA